MHQHHFLTARLLVFVFARGGAKCSQPVGVVTPPVHPSAELPRAKLNFDKLLLSRCPDRNERDPGPWLVPSKCGGPRGEARIEGGSV